MKRIGRDRSRALQVAGAHDEAPPHRVVRRVTPSRAQDWRGVLMAAILALCLTLVLFVSHIVVYPSIHAGDVAPTNLFAPRDFTYVNASATEALRQRARSMVAEQFRQDARPQRQAQTSAASVFRMALSLRALAPVTAPSSRPPSSGSHAANPLNLRAQVLTRLSGGVLPTDLATRLLTLDAVDFADVRTLVSQALALSIRQPIYPTQIPVLQTAPPFPPSVASASAITIATGIYGVFLRPNHFPDDALTLQTQAREAARVGPVTVSFRHSQVIVRSGDVVDATALAALQVAGLTGSNVSWQLLIADLLICLVVAGLLHGYLISVQSPILVRPRQLLLLDALFLSAILAVALVLQSREPLPFVFPAATLSMLLTVLLSEELSMVATAVWAVLAGWYLGASFELATYYLVTGLVGALLVRKVRRSSEFFIAGLLVSGIGLTTILAFRLLNQGYDWLGLSTYCAAAALSGGLAAALALGSLSLLGRLFGVTTGLHLLELSHPDHPLLRRLMVEAPGTYHHSMMIGNLAERAAEQIGADPLLVRVSAYFHDIGKLFSPTSFVENQSGIGNIHDTLDPRQSVALIQRHVYEGVRLARQHHLPEVLEDGIWQHHGTNLVSFFYQQAITMHGEDQVRIEDYQYPGPRPQTRETAILMLADGVEAAVRASPGVDGDQIRAIIHRLSQQRLSDGQLDECNLTLRDLALIEESFATGLQGLSHPRMQYPAPMPAVAGT